MHNLHAECGHCTIKTYENVLSNVVNVTNASQVSLAISYVAIRIMANNNSCHGVNVNSYPWLN
jgi:hypothetical protein